MKNKQFLLSVFCSFIIFFVILLSTGSYAVGIASTGTLNPTIDFKPGLEKTFSYILVPTASFMMDYEVTIDGDLEEYFTPKDSLLKDVFPREQRGFTVKMKLPEEKIPPGLHQTRICIGETKTSGGGTVGVKTKACSIIRVRSLYSNKYLKIEEFKIPDVDVGDTLKFEIKVRSWTELKINAVKATIQIFGPSKEGFKKKIATLNTETKSLESNARTTLHATINTRDFEFGEYLAIASVNYDGRIANISSKFRIGMLVVKIINYTKEFERGKVNKFEIEIESRWNQLIDNIYGEISVEDEISVLKTPFISLKPWSRATLLAFWEIKPDKELKEYTGRIAVYYENNKTEEQVKLRIVMSKEEMNRRMIVIVVVSLLILSVLAISIYLVSKKKNESKKKKAKKAKKKK
jgi:hypothetical protein